MKRILLYVSIALLLAFVFSGSRCHGGAAAAKGPDTLKVNTIESGKGIIGFNGRTPVEIAVVEGRIVYVKPLPNSETPSFFNLVVESGIFSRLNGLTVEEARQVELDAVSGATYSSEAIIQNIDKALLSIK